MRPPALHHLLVRQSGHAVAFRSRQKAEEDVRLGIEVDGIIADAGLPQEIDQFRPYRVMAPSIFLFHAGVPLHLEGMLLSPGHQALLTRRAMIGKAMVTISNRPMKIDMTMPGTFRSPSPKVTRPMTKAAIRTPMTVPAPPRMETPPSTTMVTISNS